MKRVEKDFIKIIQEYERVIYKVCSIYVSGLLPMADLYQEVVHNLWVGYPKFRNESSISTWIYRVAINTCVTTIRKEKKHFQNSSIALTSISDKLPAPEPLTEDIKEMYRLINQLKTIEKTIILLYLEEKPYKEIAEITGLTLSNVATKLKRIKEKLRKMSNV